MARKNPKLHRVFQIWILFTCACVTSNSLARPQWTFSQVVLYDQNAFRNYLALPDWINQTGLTLLQEATFKSVQMRLKYSGKLTAFAEYSDRFFHAHQVSLEDAFSPIEIVHFHSGATYQIRRYTPDLDVYEQARWSLYCDARIGAEPTAPIEAGYQFLSAGYPNLTEFSYHEHVASLRAKHFFQTRTTIMAELGFFRKSYTKSQSVEELHISGVRMGLGSSKGKGHGKSGSGMKTDTLVVARNLTIPGASQWGVRVRIAQAIAMKSGMYVEYFRKAPPEQASRYLTGQDYSYSTDDVLYDDPYTYGCHEWQLGLTQLAPWGIKLTLWGDYEEKAYVVVAEENAAQSVEKRNDTQSTVGLELNKPLEINRVVKSVNFVLAWSYIRNQSNDGYFAYEGAVFSGGFDLKF